MLISENKTVTVMVIKIRNSAHDKKPNRIEFGSNGTCLLGKERGWETNCVQK